MQTMEQVQTKTYYSRGGHRAVCITPGKVIPGPDGVAVRLDDKHINFSPVAIIGAEGKQGGILTTSDPAVIAYLDGQIARGNIDFMTPEQWFDHITPTELKLEAERQQTAKVVRELEMKNSLLADLEKDNPDLYQKLMRKRGK